MSARNLNRMRQRYGASIPRATTTREWLQVRADVADRNAGAKDDRCAARLAGFALARNIASKIETELQYPGQIKVTVIRETRCVEVAK